MAEEPSFGPGGSGSGPFSSDSSPWVWVLIPVGIVVAIGALAVCLHSKRRQRLASYLHTTAPSPPPTAQPPGTRSRAINERELEEAWVRGAPPTTQNAAIPAPGGRWVNNTNGTGSRWYWAGSEPRRARPEEGLNELGEAPPPYEKAKKPPSSPSPPPNPNGEGPAPKSGPASSASSTHRGTAAAFELGVDDNENEMEMHTLAPAITGRTLTSTASSVSDGARRSMGDPLSPFTFSGVPSTAASSVHERGLSPPPYDGLAVSAPANGAVELPTAVPVELPVPAPANGNGPPAPWAEDAEESDGDDGGHFAVGSASSSSLSSSSESSSTGAVTPPEPAVLAGERQNGHGHGHGHGQR
ncbi:hypothetical protein B0T16DRAFT_391657 [Cercophora newfieldiana]|uniref:Uncharacterized protein n=1 Tax=Cercophora newfieldiana TaxID=92897 RepID=A0AA39XZA6_9PEZI|nr:hypothetical protein B0T16DRAFT_391657 [Cercophora newfieldiana]